ncbi:MAG: sulfate ABC transporter substrate-binding protein [Desulfatiglans sp.]|jgi:sulfate transport system substrate-binding protein|nr:sulfate ABC transporter substrate-binding protein [Desulfatiglans sp.]
MRRYSITILLILLIAIIASLPVKAHASGKKTLLNVSYDPTRKFYQEINLAFNEYWQKVNSTAVDIRQSHGGSGKQARSVIDGLHADVVTLALAYDIDSIADKSDLLPKEWQKRFPNNSSPYTSTIVLLVRKNNPKKIKDWDDLAKPGLAVITPNPKTSGGARWNYLAAWGYALLKWGNGEEKAKEFVKAIYKNVPILDSGARGSTTTFIERKIGDVLISWENEAYLVVNKPGKDEYEIVVPSISILAEPPVAIIDRNAERHGTADLAKAYIQFLYSEHGQEIAAKNYYRPRLESVLCKYTAQFQEVNLITIEDIFGGWEKAHATHFADRGIFDQIYQAY